MMSWGTARLYSKSHPRFVVDLVISPAAPYLSSSLFPLKAAPAPPHPPSQHPTSQATTLPHPLHTPSHTTVSENVQVGLVGLITRPVIKSVIPSEKVTSTSNPSDPASESASAPNSTSAPQATATAAEQPSGLAPDASPLSPVSSALTSQLSTTPSSQTSTGDPVLQPAQEAPTLNVPIDDPQTEKEPQLQPEEEQTTSVTPLVFPQPHVRNAGEIGQEIPSATTATTTDSTQPLPTPAPAPAPASLSAEQSSTTMALVEPTAVEDADQSLASKAADLDLNDRPASRATQRTSRTVGADTVTGAKSSVSNYGAGEGVWAVGGANGVSEPAAAEADAGDEDEDEAYLKEKEQDIQNKEIEQSGTGAVLASEPSALKAKETVEDEQPQRPSIGTGISRSYVKPIPIVTTYEPELPDNASVQTKRRTIAGSIKAPSAAPSVKRASSRAPSRAPSRAETIDDIAATEAETDAGTDAGTIPAPSKALSIKRPSSRAASVRSSRAGNNFAVVSTSHDNGALPSSDTEGGQAQYTERPSSRAASTRRMPNDAEAGAAGVGAGTLGGLAVGQYVSGERQRELQARNGNTIVSRRASRTSFMHENGVLPRDRSRTFEDPHSYSGSGMSPRPHSAFGYRPQPQLLAINEQGGDRDDGRDSRAGVLGRSGTVTSRANTLGRNGTLTRGANGGTIGSRRGAFGRGAGASIGTQPEEVLGRDDIHTRAELSERILDEATLHRLSNMERKDALRLTKVIKQEAKAEAKAVQGSIKELEHLVRLQRESAGAERKSQARLSKWTTKEHKARMRFLKEKERYERIEGELRNAENDYEERRDHAGGLTAQVAEKTQELDDLRAQKAADDREREVKILALKNPAHS